MKDLFVFCADLHLADGAWTSRPTIYGDSYYSFEQIVDCCINKNLPLVIGGDVLDVKRNWARPIQVLCREMNRMLEAALPVYFIQGQHELDRNMPWMRVHPWPQHVNKRTFDIQGVRLYGIDWLPREEIQVAFSEVPEDTDILVTHQVWKNFMKNVGRPECCLQDVHHVNTVLSGDFHVTTVEEDINAQGKPVKLISTGSTCMQDISECPDKVFYTVAYENDECVITQQSLKTRRMRAYTVKDENTLDELCAGKFLSDIADMSKDLPEIISKPLVRVKFAKELPDAHLRITTAIGDAAHLFCDAILDKSQSDTLTNRTHINGDLISIVEELIGATPEAFKLAAALLAAEDPAAELSAIENQYRQTETGCAASKA